MSRAESMRAVKVDVDRLAGIVGNLEFRRMFSNPLDPANCFIDIQAGSGGTEAQDWASMLMDSKTQKEVGKYYAGPTWESMDGSKVTGKQVAVAPAAAGNIPMQLVKTEPAMGNGAMTGISYIQRVNTKGGTAPSDPCTSAVAGSRKTVPYQADYVFYKM